MSDFRSESPAKTLSVHDAEVEQAVLGAILLAAAECGEAISLLRSEDFYVQKHRCIFEAIVSLSREGASIDLVTVTDRLRTTGKLDDAGGASSVTGLLNANFTTANVDHYAGIVRRHGRRRALARLGVELSGGHNDPEELERRARETLDRLEGHSDAPRRRVPHPKGLTADELMRQRLEPPAWIVDAILPQGLTLLSGRPKKGKSALARNLAVAVATGGRALGQVSVRKGGVLFLAYEDSPARLQDRVSRLLADAPAPDDLLFHPSTLPWPRADRGGMVALDAWLCEHSDTRLVVVDTLAKFRRPRKGHQHDLYEEDYEALGSLKELADAHGVGVLVVTHSRKAGADDPIDAPIGTTGVTAAPDTLWNLARGRGQGDAELHLVGRDVEEATLALRFDTLTLSWLLLGDAEVYRRGQERQQVVETIAHAGNSLGPKDVAAAIGKRVEAVSKLMWTMANRGEIVHADRGRYSLPPRELRSGTRPCGSRWMAAR